MGSKELTYHINIESDISDFQKDIKIMQNSLSKVNLKSGLKDSFNELFMDINDSIDKISKINAKGKLNPLDEKTMQKTMDLLDNSYSRLIKKINSQGLASSSLIKDQKAIEGLVKAQEKYKEQIRKTVEQEAKLKKEISTLQKKADKKAKAKEYVNDIEAQKKAIQEKKDLLTKAEEKHEKRKAKGFSNEKRLSTYKEVQQAQDEYVKAQEKLVSLEAESEEYNKRSKGQLEDYRKLLIEISNKKKDLKNYQDTTVSTKKADALKTIIKDLKALESSKKISFSDYGIDLDKITDADQLKTSIEKIEQVLGVRMQDVVNGLKLSSENTKNSLDNMRRGADVASDGLDKLLKKQNALDDAKRKILSFFSIDNAVMLFKRSLNSAKETIKELDATMTEAAVVTDFSVGDMWEKLPEYSAEANKLGASINDLYGATTLYYQQGLKTEEAMSVGIETMKMARIANMNAEEATKAMTAALRGFNMEVNELNAKRVNDVYSELAAITAADTSQIATAMSKTASIASAANMEFETTAALLAQIIETTQEAPETAGTAMKTIIARFTEVKKLADEGALSGKDGEGEEIVINKIDGALQQVGISLSDFLNGTKGIDDIFLELASKWDSLDLATQRYIATQAAGSRQQSRFLAMMSDYKHSMELVEAANNSAGASDIQFGKTLDSLESKINKLKNAWDQFTMGLANSSAVKNAVDLATNFLTIVNELTEAISFGSDGLKSFFSILAGAGGVYGGNKVLTKTLDKIGGLWGLGEAAENKRTEKALIDRVRQAKLDKQNAGIDLKERLKRHNYKSYRNLKATKNYYAADRNLKDSRKELLDFQNASGLSDQNSFIEKTLKKVRESKENGKNTITLDKVSFGDGIGQKLEKLKDLKKGMKGFSFKKITVPFSIFGKTVAVTASSLLSVVGALTAIVAVITTIGLLIRHFSLAKDLERAEQAAERVNASLSKVKEKYTDFQTTRNDYDNLHQELDGLVEGTQAWRDKLEETNLQTQEILNKYQSLAKYRQEDENGIVTISKEGWDEYEKKLKQTKSIVGASATFVNAKKQHLNNLNNAGEKLRNVSGSGVFWGFQTDQIERFAEDFNAEDYEKGTDRIVDSINNSTATLEQAYKTGIASVVNSTDIKDEYRPKISEAISDSFSSQDTYKYTDTGYFGHEDSRYRNLVTWGNDDLNHGMKNLAQDLEFLTGESFGGDEKDVLLQAHETLLGENWEGKLEDIDNQGEDGFVSTLSEFLPAIYTAVMAKAMDELAANSPQIANLLSEDMDYSKINFDTLHENIGNIDQILTDLNLQDGLGNEIREALYEAEYQVLDTEFESIKTLEKAFGKNTNNEDVIKAGKAVDKADKELQDAIKNGPAETDKTLEDYYQAKADAIIKYEEQINTYLKNSGIVDNFNGDKNLAIKYGSLMTGVQGEATKGALGSFANQNRSKADLESIVHQFENIDTSSLIDVHDKLIQISNDADNVGQVMAQAALEGDAALYSVTNEANELFETLGQEELKKLGEDGKITSTEIYELGKSNKKVQKVLDNTGVSAATLGNYFKMLDEGVLGTIDTFGNFVKVLDKAQAAQNTIEDSLGFIDTFEPKRSETDIGEWWQGSQEKIVDLINKGAYGSSQLQSYMESFYGKINWDTMVNESGLEAALKSAQTDIESYGSNMYGLWEKFINSGQTEGMVSYGDNGSIDFNTQNFKSVDELQSQIQQATGFSDTIAKAMIADAQTFSADLKQELNKLSLKDTLVEWLNSAYKIDGTAYVTKKQTEILAKSLGFDPKEFEKAIEGQVTIIESIIDNETGKLREEIQKKIVDSFTSQFSTDGSLDSSNVINYLISLDLDDTQIEKALPTLLKKISEEANGKFVEDADGTLKLVAKDAEGTAVEITEGLAKKLVAANGDDRIKLQQDLMGIRQAEVMAKGTAEGIIQGLGAIFSEKSKVGKSIFGKDAYDSDGNLKNNTVKGLSTTAKKKIGDSYKQDKQDIEKELKGLPKTEQDSGKVNIDDILKRLRVDLNGGSSYTIPNAQTKYEDKNGKGGKDKEKPWENPYDRLYNLTEQINEELRQREKLERQYQRLLKDESTSIYDLQKNQKARISTLQKEIELQQHYQAERLSDINLLGKKEFYDEDGKITNFEKSGATKYAKYDSTTGTVQIDWEGINNITDPVLGKAVEDYISELERLSSDYEETQQTIEEMQDTIEEIEKENIEEYLSFEERVLNALVQQKQKVIDDYNSLSSEIAETNNEVLDAMKESIELERQIRDNTKTEADIADKERKLGFLQRDTSGANDLEILRLQEEIAQDRQNYGDQLIDQELERIADESARAEKQREKQIEIMQAQLEWGKINGEYWGEVEGLLFNAIDPESGELKNNSSLVKLLQASEGFQGMSEVKKTSWMNTLAIEFSKSMDGYANARVEEAQKTGIDFGDGVKGTYDKGNKVWIDSNGNYIRNVGYDVVKGKFTHGEIQNKEEYNPNGTVIEKPAPPANNGGGGGNPPRTSGKPATSGADNGNIQGFDWAGHKNYLESTLGKKSENNAVNTIKNWAGKFKSGNFFHNSPDSYMRTPDNVSLPWLFTNTYYFNSGIGNFKYGRKQSGKNYDYTKKDKYGLSWKNLSEVTESDAIKILDGTYPVWAKTNTLKNGKGTEWWVPITGGHRPIYRPNGKSSKYPAFKTGGLADYTGPAWLDGTKSHPELVLNAQDTENFIKLKDILSSIMSNSQSSNQSAGDNYFDIHINVDEIANDYDVDQLANKIQRKINEDATYRNVNAINFLR